MARLRVSYHMPDGRGSYYPFFTNFINSVEKVRVKHHYDVIKEILIAEYGVLGITIDNGIMEIEFSTEEDITSFLVRWS